ncbi:hypothetical protein KAU32_07515 [bacterium]|nr:hypothetical protein [bacterium]
MRFRLDHWFLLVVAVIIAAGCVTVEARQNIPMKDIPHDIPLNVRKEIERLYSSLAVKRGEAALCLGEMGERAAPAVPFLIEILDDNRELEWCKLSIPGGLYDVKGEYVSSTSASAEAEKALIKIVKPAVKPLIAALRFK